MLLEAMLQTAIGFPRRDCKQPSAMLQRIEQFEYAIEQRFLHLSCDPQPHEVTLILFRQLRMIYGTGIGEKPGHRLNQAEPDHASRDARRWNLEPVLAKRFAKRGVNRRTAVDQGPVAVKDGEPAHDRFDFPCDPRERRSPRRSRRRDLAAAATLRRLASGVAEALGCSSGRLSPASGSNPSIVRLSAKCAGRSAVASIAPPSGASIRIRRAWRWSLRLIPPVRNASGPPYLASPTIG